MAEITADQLKSALASDSVRAAIAAELTNQFNTGLDDAVTSQLKSLGLIDSTTEAAADDANQAGEQQAAA